MKGVQLKIGRDGCQCRKAGALAGWMTGGQKMTEGWLGQNAENSK